MYGFSKDTHEIAEHIIRNEILCCDSALIDELLRSDVIVAYDDIENLYCCDEDDECEHCGGVGYQEVFEWWRVTDYLCGKLRNAGEPVIDNEYGCWWGRTCTGQAIILDGTIQRIVEGSK